MDTPTIYDVSRLSGVSTATVSRSFTAPERVREETRRKVLAAAEALGYQPSAIARAMARQQTDKIAFLICKKDATILDEFYASICEGVMRRANSTSYQLLISTAADWQRTGRASRSRASSSPVTPSRPSSRAFSGRALQSSSSTTARAASSCRALSRTSRTARGRLSTISPPTATGASRFWPDGFPLTSRACATAPSSPPCRSTASRLTTRAS